MVDAKFLIHDLLVQIHEPKISNSDRKKVEDQLRSLEQFKVQHTRDLCDIVATQDLPVTSPIKAFASYYMRDFVERKVSKPSAKALP